MTVDALVVIGTGGWPQTPRILGGFRLEFRDVPGYRRINAFGERAVAGDPVMRGQRPQRLAPGIRVGRAQAGEFALLVLEQDVFDALLGDLRQA